MHLLHTRYILTNVSQPFSRSSRFIRLDYRHIRWSFFFFRFPVFQFQQNSLSLPAFFVVVSCQPVKLAKLLSRYSYPQGYSSKT